MNDPRITVRLTRKEHEAFKIQAVKAGMTMSEILHKYILQLISEDVSDEK